MGATAVVQLTSQDRASETRSVFGRLAAIAPLGLVVAAVIFNLVSLKSETTSVAYLNDGTLHSEMVRFATAQIRAGHLPLTGWFPLLGEGSPLFIHYQSLGAMLTGGLGALIGPNTAYAWMLYLLLATWPISIYATIRLLGFDRLSAGLGALLSPLIVSRLGIGYEQQSYLSIGYGLWSQLFAMWTLPLAWGWTWRATESRRAILPATAFITLTIAFHYFTGYLALLGVVVAFATSSTPFRARVRRCFELVLSVVLTSAWIIVPLLELRRYASINEFLVNGPDVNSYGARQILSWLVTGQLFDAHRLPVLTVLVGLGLLVTIVGSRTEPASRNLLTLFVLSLMLFFGRTTFGAMFRLLPGSADLFLRRFLIGVQLAGLIFAAVALGTLSRAIGATYRRLRSHLGLPRETGATQQILERALCFALLVLVLLPCWSQIVSIDRAEAANITFQRRADQTAGAVIAPIITRITRLGGRVYAGLPVPSGEIGGWGSSFTVGEVPVFKYLTRFNIDVVGYTLRTASLMTDPEAYFAENMPADFPLFGVRWLIYPIGKPAPSGATKIMVRGPYVLWQLHSAGVLEVVDTVGTMTADRTNIGAHTASFVRSDLAARSRYLTVGFAGSPAPAPTVTLGTDHGVARPPASTPGRMISSRVALGAGYASAVIDARRVAVVVLKASYDPGWQVSVDGRAATTQMIAPAYVGVVVSRGRHVVTFTYKSDAHIGVLLLVLLGSALLCIARFRYARSPSAPRSSRRRYRRAKPADTSHLTVRNEPSHRMGTLRGQPRQVVQTMIWRRGHTRLYFWHEDHDLSPR